MLSQRYISDRFLPDKAIDLIDEAASKLRIEIDSMPEELDDLERRTKQLEIEKVALTKEKDQASKKRLLKVDQDIANLKEKSNELKLQWQSEKTAIQSIREIKSKIENYKLEMDSAERDGNLERVAKIRYGLIPEAEQKMSELNSHLIGLQQQKTLLKEEVTEEDIAEIVSKWTGIPVQRMMESEKEKLLNRKYINFKLNVFLFVI